MTIRDFKFLLHRSRWLPMLFILALLAFPVIACLDDETPTPESDAGEIIRVVEGEDQQDDDDPQPGDDDPQPQTAAPVVFTDGINDPICCNLCDPQGGVTLPPYLDLTQITFTWVVSNGSCHGEFVMEFGQAQALNMPFMGYITWYDPSRPLPGDDLYCWGKFGNSSHGFIFDGMRPSPYYSVVDPQTENWTLGDAPGYEVLMDTTAFTLRIPCDQLDPAIPWMAHTFPPQSFPCDGMGQGDDLFPNLYLPEVEW